MKDAECRIYIHTHTHTYNIDSIRVQLTAQFELYQSIIKIISFCPLLNKIILLYQSTTNSNHKFESWIRIELQTSNFKLKDRVKLKQPLTLVWWTQIEPFFIWIKLKLCLVTLFSNIQKEINVIKSNIKKKIELNTTYI